MNRNTTKSLFLLLIAVCIPEFIFSQHTTHQFVESYKIVIAGDYEVSGFTKFFAGEHWRDLWITPIKIQILDLNKFAGPIQADREHRISGKKHPRHHPRHEMDPIPLALLGEIDLDPLNFNPL